MCLAQRPSRGIHVPKGDHVTAQAAGGAFWRDRPTLVTGATGLLGGWLVARLVDAGADVVCLVRDWVPDSQLVRAGLLERTKLVRGESL